MGFRGPVAIAACVIMLSACSAAPLTPDDDPSELTIEQRLRAVADEQWNDVLVQYEDAERPPYAVVRMIDHDEWGEVIARCMNEAGFPSVKDSGDGGVLSGDLVISQGEAYAIAMYDCNARYPLDPKFNEPVTDEDLSLIYDYLVDTQMPCLEAHGYEVVEPPSRQQFIENYETDPWIPSGPIIMAIAQTDDFTPAMKLLEDCPDTPPFWN